MGQRNSASGVRLIYVLHSSGEGALCTVRTCFLKSMVSVIYEPSHESMHATNTAAAVVLRDRDGEMWQISHLK